MSNDRRSRAHPPILESARRVIRMEAAAVAALESRLHKIAATLTSTGTLAMSVVARRGDVG